jgi:biopolymer transport protein ExbD
MSKIKMKRKSPHVDMTPMVDLFSLLLTFFMLTTSFRPQEAAVIDTPYSVSEKQAPDKNLITIAVTKDNKVFFDMSNSGTTFDAQGKEIADTSSHYRRQLIKKIAEQNQIAFTDKEIKTFETGSSFGMSFLSIKSWLDATEPKVKEGLMKGIPIDSTEANPSGELGLWVRFARILNPNAEVAIKGDGDADYKIVKRVMDIMQENKVQKFNLVTNLQKEDLEGEEPAK